jgi:hypothetical protein
MDRYASGPAVSFSEKPLGRPDATVEDVDLSLFVRMRVAVLSFQPSEPGHKCRSAGSTIAAADVFSIPTPAPSTPVPIEIETPFSPRPRPSAPKQLCSNCSTLEFRLKKRCVLPRQNLPDALVNHPRDSRLEIRGAGLGKQRRLRGGQDLNFRLLVGHG